MHSDSIMSQVWKTTARTVVGIFSLFAIVLILPRPVAALQTALVRTSDGSVYQIRFLNNDSRDIGDFIDDFSIYNQTGDIELCPGNDESVTWELYTAARVLASTPRRTPIYEDLFSLRLHGKRRKIRVLVEKRTLTVKRYLQKC
jgi:hypothetical protein